MKDGHTLGEDLELAENKRDEDLQLAEGKRRDDVDDEDVGG